MEIYPASAFDFSVARHPSCRLREDSEDCTRARYAVFATLDGFVQSSIPFRCVCRPRFLCSASAASPQIVLLQFAIERPLADTEQARRVLAVAVAEFQGVEDVVFFDFLERSAYQRVDPGSSIAFRA